jgi:hypothetical protein
MPPKLKQFSRHRRIREADAKKSARVKIQVTDRKQMIRQAGPRRGGR